ncbi:hypothetical protein [Streptomyces sp. GbtcB7]|uniref:hypothetical protein n=1 Tax=Streptomyces sp. GbtcB7 TaxID=2824752 RepID=UPI0020C6D0FB|nr:hypothetical protein [Streptomyces sp. GbtcB7]
MTSPPSPPSVIHQQRLDRLAAFLRAGEQVLAAWDAYSDQHADPDCWPYDDETYGRRAARRDADTWTAAVIPPGSPSPFTAPAAGITATTP